MSRLSCPVCGDASPRNLLSLDCGNLDGSSLYPTVRLMACPVCGHHFNDLSPEDIAGLGRYYNDEYAPANLNSVVKDGDLPGSTGKFTSDRYGQLYALIAPHVGGRGAILDVGCAVGGFLDFLKVRGYLHLYGVDLTQAYVELARRKNYEIRLGDAQSLPFGDRLFDALVVEQVLEHLLNPVAAFREAARVLKPGGVLCIGVPDAARYGDYYYFDFYWLLMREHIQHFDIASLKRLAESEGFDLVDYQQTAHPIMGEKMVMPNLSAVFRKRSDETVADTPCMPVAPTVSLERYVQEENARLAQRRQSLGRIAESGRPVYVWGIGREFLYLYEAAGLKNCALEGLVDMNPFKQETATVGGRKVVSPDTLSGASGDSCLLITAIAHDTTIRERLESHQLFNGEILSL